MAEQNNFDWSVASEDVSADLPNTNVLFSLTCVPCEKQIAVRSCNITLCKFDNDVVTYQYICPNCLVRNLIVADESVQETLNNIKDISESSVTIPDEFKDRVREKESPMNEDDFIKFCRNLSNCVNLAHIARSN